MLLRDSYSCSRPFAWFMLLVRNAASYASRYIILYFLAESAMPQPANASCIILYALIFISSLSAAAAISRHFRPCDMALP